MESVSQFTRLFSQLVWLLVHKNEQQDEQKEVLRRALVELSERSQTLVLPDLSFAVSEEFQHSVLGPETMWLSELSVRMSAHSVRSLEFEHAAQPRDVLGVARALGSDPSPGDEGAAFDQQMLALEATSVTAQMGRMGFVRCATPLAHPALPARTPSLGMRALSEVAPMTGLSPFEPVDPGPQSTIMRGKDQAAIMQQLLRTPSASDTLQELLRRIETVTSSDASARAIEDITHEAEVRGRQGLWVDLAVVMDRLHTHVDSLHDGDQKRLYQMFIHRLERTELMQGIARLLPYRREIREAVTRILARSGDSGADALIDLLVSAENTVERRTYRSALVRCPAAVPALKHLMGDGRWFVVRNAADLLGELAPTDADLSLIDAIGHRDPRVRRSVVSALAKVGGTKAVLALLQAIFDVSPDVRMQVALGLGELRSARAVPWLVEALDREQDPDVQAAMLGALGRMPTEESVSRLGRAAEAGGMLLRRSVEFRLKAVEALGEAATPSAHSALRGLLNDRDSSVRESAEKALGDRVGSITR